MLHTPKIKTSALTSAELIQPRNAAWCIDDDPAAESARAYTGTHDCCDVGKESGKNIEQGSLEHWAVA